MKLSELLQGYAQTTDAELDITGIALDSRNVKAGEAFIAVAGNSRHGLAYARQALDRGAVALIYEPADGIEVFLAGVSDKTARVAVPLLGKQLGNIAARFYGDPSAKLAVIGVTGTNGKTSCSQFLAQALGNCGVIGTLGWGIPGYLRQTLNTTPDALTLQTMLAEFAEQGRQAVAMEVSSHALEQGRVNGIHFRAAVYTNFSRDHLDYHGSMEAYVAAKLSLLQKPGIDIAVLNLDDVYCRQALAALPQGMHAWGYSRSGREGTPGIETLLATAVRHLSDGVQFDAHWQGRSQTIGAPVFGDFNVENILATLGVLLALGMPMEMAAERIRNINPVPGRMERYALSGLPAVFVDYAHTPDALDKVLASLRPHCCGKLWVVFGCGGNRDRGKRQLMGVAAEKWADEIVLTDDNPRDEDPDSIIEAILAGCVSSAVRIIRDRGRAIEFAVGRAAVADMILVAGKGHEDYQEISGKQLPFSDSLAVQEALRRRGKHHAHTT